MRTFLRTSIDVVFIHYEQCSWGPESAKKPTTKQYVESLRKMNFALEQRNRSLERQLALYASSRPAGGVVQNHASAPGLRIPSRGSTSSFGGPPSPASTQSEPIFLKTEEQDGIDQIIAPTHDLHVRNPHFHFFFPHALDNLTNFVLLPV